MLYIVMYHYVRDLKHSRYPDIKGMDVALFRQWIGLLKANFSVVQMEQVLVALYGQISLSANAVLLTFDDAFIANYTYSMPFIEDVNVQGSSFIP